MTWADGDDERCIFWLNGMAGTGKSTIARTIARKYYEQERLGASFFFSRGGGDVSHAGKFFTSIAVQLANKSPSLKQLHLRSYCRAQRYCQPRSPRPVASACPSTAFQNGSRLRPITADPGDRRFRRM